MKKLEDGEWVEPRAKNFRLGCCDCGLVHRVDFRVIDGALQLRAFRMPRSTSNLRKRMGVTVKAA
jgi:hypothetical protein